MKVLDFVLGKEGSKENKNQKGNSVDLNFQRAKKDGTFRVVNQASFWSSGDYS